MFIVKGEVYPFDVMVSFGDSKKKLSKELSKYLPKGAIKELEIPKLGVGRAVMFTSGPTLLWLKEKPTTVKGLAVLNHEIFHCACFILDRVGISHSEETNEAYAYFIQYLTEKIYDELNITFS